MAMVLNDSTSIYLQIAALVEDSILKDILLEEEQAPSTNELARIYTINPATAAKGLNLLVEEGILYKKRGLGMFVATGAKQKIQYNRKAAFTENFVKPMAEEAKSLGLSSEELAALVHAAMQG